MQFTNDMLLAAIRAMAPDRIKGFSTPGDTERTDFGNIIIWGPPYVVRDVWKKPGEQVLWRGDSHSEMMERCEMERLRIGLEAAFKLNKSTENTNG